MPTLAHDRSHLLWRCADKDWRAIEQLEQNWHEFLQEVRVGAARTPRFNLVPQFRRRDEF
jgi:hypothetical protein